MSIGRTWVATRHLCYKPGSMSATTGGRWGRSRRSKQGLLDRVLEGWGFPRPDVPSRDALDAVHQAYLDRVPFENATKLLKTARSGTAGAAMRGPVEFWEDHLRLGSGGTCFASASAYQFLLRYLGFASRPLFCQLPASEPRAHVAILVTVESTPVLVDVGYALPAPVPLPANGSMRRETPYYDIEIRRGIEDEYLLFSEDGRGVRFRYRFTLDEVPEEALRQAWAKTFSPKAPYMRRLALGRFRDGVRYLHKDPRSIFEITRDGERARPLGEPANTMLSNIFGLPEPLLTAASRVLGSPLEASSS